MKPTTVILGYEHAIVSDDILVFDPNGPLRNYKDSMSASFTWPSGKIPGSILVNKGKTLCGSACHAWLGYPETVLYRYKSGTFGIGRFKYDTEIPKRADILWAVGGCGMLELYNPLVEGFCKGFRPDGVPFNFTDVLRATAHTVLAIKGGKCYQIYIHYKTAYQINLWLKANGFEIAVMMDGGHIPAMNGSTAESKINMDIEQGFATQGIEAVFGVTPTTPNVEDDILVIFDAGHNALNRSNRSPDGTYIEADFTLEMVNLIMPHVVRCGMRTKMVESISANQAFELNDLVSKIDASGGDVMVSIHTDAHADYAIKGQTIYCYELEGEGMRLAQAIHDATIPESGMHDMGIRDGSESIRVIFAPKMPCVLIECGYHTNDDDLTRLKSKIWKEKEAELIAKGIAKHFNKEWIPPVVTVPSKLFLVVEQHGAFKTKEAAQAEVVRLTTPDNYVYIMEK